MTEVCFGVAKLVGPCCLLLSCWCPGNRSKHYRQNKSGATLVHFLGDEVPPSVATFQRLVEAAMPGMYDWFPPESLHITLRSLC